MENGKANSGSNPKGRPRVVVVGSGFAGFTCARELERRLRPEDAELVLASPTDYLLYSPLLPEVATGVIDPRECANRRGRLSEPEPREGRSDVISTTARSVKGSATNRQTTRRRRA